jgi:prepilin peptidase CpaA
MIPLLLFLVTLAIGVATDVRARRVPNLLVVTMLGLAGAGALWSWSPAGSVGHAVGGMAGGLGLWLPFWLLGLLGAGDVKFFAAGSAWIGWPLAWRAAVITAVLGGLMGILVLVNRGGVRRTMAGVLLQYQQATRIIASADASAADAKARTFPYAVPMAIALATAAINPPLLLRW